MRQTPGFFKIVASMMWLAWPVVAEPATDPSSMERSREMRHLVREATSGGDVRQLVQLSQRQQASGEGLRVIQAPALRGDASSRGYAAASTRRVEESILIGARSTEAAWPASPVAWGGFSRQVRGGDGWVYSGGSMRESTFVTGVGGYFYTRRQVYHPIVVVVRDADPWKRCGSMPPRVTYVHRACPPPTVTICSPRRPSGFGFFLQF